MAETLASARALDYGARPLCTAGLEVAADGGGGKGAPARPRDASQQAARDSKPQLNSLVRPLEIKDENNNNNNNDDHEVELTFGKHSSSSSIQGINAPSCTLKAVVFKYKESAPRDELESIRKLLVEQRGRRVFSADQWNFVKSDYERMMIDDWLVTRFLLRGKKAAAAAAAAQCDSVATHKSLQGREFAEAHSALALAKTISKATIYAKTLELIEICANYRYEYRINAHTKESEFPIEWTSVNGMFHYGHDRAGNPIAYLRVALHKPKLIETKELRYEFYRYMLYVLEQCDQDLFQKTGKAICCVFDMSDVAFENIDLELTTWMIKSFKNCAPKLLSYVIVYNPPWFFAATFKLICNTLLSDNRRQSIKFAHGREIHDYIDNLNLPPYLSKRLSSSR